MKVCCLIVTFNRKNLLIRCIEHCLAQDVNPDVLVFDNASTDGTEELLKSKGYLDDDRIIYYKSSKNLGGAGGFAGGLKSAIESDYDFVWLMDDDGYPRHKEALKNCIEAYDTLGGNSIVNAIVYDENNYLSFKLGDCESLSDIERKHGNDNILLNVLAPFNGTLISKEVVDKIGFPRGDFFIKGDEFEYVTRARINGIGWATVRNADFYHPRFIVAKTKLLWKEIPLNEEPAWKEYCRARNHYYITKTYYGRIALFKHILVETIRCMTYTSDKKIKRKATIRGLIDGKHNIFLNENVMKFKR